MITKEQLETAIDRPCRFLSDQAHSFIAKIPKTDKLVYALSLLRERIPYDECKRIIEGADHDIIYLCDVKIACKYLQESDIPTIADCIHINDECLAAFV